ncbi:MAG: NAD(P)-dependent oxidoreductase [Aestuariivita sp.]|nr:NAD(P)-dependent oxidoreductase [Aestuariivita sp.]MCY4201807.1 NAD(P)-dependent oxidoreductase [Aestuariivita sp.]
MDGQVDVPDIRAGRLGGAQLAENFADLHPPLKQYEAVVAADRCFFCYEAPCITACPTEIDIPLFIRQIQADQPLSAAKTIFDQNILGGMCARVCPTETLCEQACVRELSEGKSVEIGRLQRFATDQAMAVAKHPYDRERETGKRVVIIGAGPAGLACAHRLAMKGHAVDILERRSKPGGLNEYGIAAYKTKDNFAAAEIEWLLQIGGITLRTTHETSDLEALEAIIADYDAVFVAVGLDGVNSLNVAQESLSEVQNAVEYIATLRQTTDLSTLPIGRHVVVIGGGMTAIDAAVQTKLLGAESVTIAYRREQSAMPASRYEQDIATSRGVRILCNVQPLHLGRNSNSREIELEYTTEINGQLRGTGETLRLSADQVLLAIGQSLDQSLANLTLESGKIKTNSSGRTNLEKVWAGGDCATNGTDLTVTAVAQGRDAAEDIHNYLMTQNYG